MLPGSIPINETWIEQSKEFKLNLSHWRRDQKAKQMFLAQTTGLFLSLCLFCWSFVLQEIWDDCDKAERRSLSQEIRFQTGLNRFPD